MSYTDKLRVKEWCADVILAHIPPGSLCSLQDIQPFYSLHISVRYLHIFKGVLSHVLSRVRQLYNEVGCSLLTVMIRRPV